jgi:hypothetical protein
MEFSDVLPPINPAHPTWDVCNVWDEMGDVDVSNNDCDGDCDADDDVVTMWWRDKVMTIMIRLWAPSTKAVMRVCVWMMMRRWLMPFVGDVMTNVMVLWVEIVTMGWSWWSDDVMIIIVVKWVVAIVMIGDENYGEVIMCRIITWAAWSHHLITSWSSWSPPHHIIGHHLITVIITSSHHLLEKTKRFPTLIFSIREKMSAFSQYWKIWWWYLDSIRPFLSSFRIDSNRQLCISRRIEISVLWFSIVSCFRRSRSPKG